MRGFKQTLNHFRYMRSTKAIVASVFTLAMIITAGVGIYKVNMDSTYAADCSDNSIVRCGYGDMNGLAAAYNANQNGDVRAIYDHYWVRPTLAPGERAVMGVADNRGNVVAEGRVVGTNAQSIGRQAIQGSHTISIAGKTYYETSHVGGTAFKPGTTQLPALVVLDANGNPKFAVLTDCGNPIYFTPVMTPPPAPQPKDIQVCDLTTKQIVTIKEDQFDAKKHSKNLDDCKPKQIQVCELTTKKVITINEDQFDAKKHSKNLADCKPAPKNIKVCDLTTKKIVTIEEKDFDATKHSKNLKDCEEKCPVPGKEHLPKDSPECITPAPVKPVSTPPAPAPAPQPAPAQLPVTGTDDALGAGVGLAALGLSVYYFWLSRRNLM